MIFAILFIVAFAVSLTVYLLTGKWLAAMLVSTSLFVLNTVIDSSQSDNVFFNLVLGLPVVFFASLLGAYVVELRRGLGIDDIEQEQTESETQSNPEHEQTETNSGSTPS